MNRNSILLLSQAALCWLEAFLISKISIFGKIGIALVHREYRLLRSGVKTFLLFFCIQAAIILLLNFAYKKFPRKRANLISTVLLITAVLGLLTTYFDFQDTYSHRLLKERFHLGFYLFWLGWIGTCIVFIAGKKNDGIVNVENKMKQNSPTDMSG